MKILKNYKHLKYAKPKQRKYALAVCIFRLVFSKCPNYALCFTPAAYFYSLNPIVYNFMIDIVVVNSVISKQIIALFDATSKGFSCIIIPINV